MASLADAYVRIRPDTSGLDADGISKPASEMGKKAGEAAGKSFGSTFSNLMKVAATAAAGIATGQIASFFKSTITAASDVSESTNKIKVVFGQSTKAVLDFGKQSSTSMGISKRSYLEAVGTLGNLFVALKLPGPQAAKMSTDMVKLAGDLASFNNVKPEQALEALRSGLIGETEPLRAFGVNLNDATVKAQAVKMGLIDTVKDGLTPAQKATATYALILDQTKTAQGDFARTSDGLANSTRIAAAQWDDLKAKIGEQFLPIATKTFAWIKKEALPALESFVNGLQGVDDKAGGLAGNMNTAGNAIRGFFEGLAGHKTDVDGIAGTMNGIGNAIRDTGEWVKNNADLIITAIGTYAAYKIGVDLVAGATKAWAAAQALLNGSLLANPVGLVVAAVVGFIAIWITAYNRVQWFHDAVNWWFGHLLQVAQWWLNGWKDVLNDAMPFLKWFGDGWSKTFSDAKNATESFTTWFASGWGQTFANARPPAESFLTWFATGWAKTFSDAKTNYDAFDVWFTQGWRQTFADATTTFNQFDAWFTQGWVSTFADARNGAQAFFTWFTSGWTATFAEARATGTAWFSWFTSGWAATLNDARSTGTAFFSWFTSGWSATLNDARNALSSFFTWFTSGWTSAITDARNTLSSFWTWFTNGWKTALTDATSAVASGVDAIGRYWNTLQDKVKTPINFVIGFINRGIINPVNSLVDVFGGTKIGQIPGLAGGGLLRGPGTGTSDSILGLSAGGQATARVSNGEFVVNQKQTAKHLPILQAINSGVEGFAVGGLIGDAIGLITDPIGSLSSGLGTLAGQIGGNKFEQMLLGVPKKIIEWAASWIKGKFTSLLGGGGPAALGGPGGNSAAAILAWARVFDPSAQISSGYRPGAADYHGAGLAADIIGSNMDGIAAGFYAMSGRLLELIHSPSWFVKNGARVGADFYRSVFAEHFNHVHVAAYANALGFADGGVINEPIWGVGKSGRQYTFGERGPETVVPGVGAGGGGGFQFNVHVHGDVSDAHVQQIKTHVNDAFSKFYVQLKTGRRR
jgi:hypothetical protein